MSPLTDYSMIGERITEEMDIASSDLTRENVAIFLLSSSKEFQRVSTELKSATHVGDPAVFQWRFSGLSETQGTCRNELAL